MRSAQVSSAIAIYGSARAAVEEAGRAAVDRVRGQEARPARGAVGAVDRRLGMWHPLRVCVRNGGEGRKSS